jgi:uncharacterized protein
MVIQPFTLQSTYNLISGVLTLPGTEGGRACVILSHGLVSSKESSKYVALSEQLADAGIAATRFDYHGCGESGGDITGTTLTIRLENLSRIMDFLLNHPLLDVERIGILGSSFGGATAIVKAARDPRVRCTSFWATPSVLEEKEDQSIADIVFQKNIYEDFRSYDILAEARRVSHALVIHGSADEVVPCGEGIEIFRNLREPKQCEIIEGADHVFSDPAHRERVITLALEWFRQHL